MAEHKHVTFTCDRCGCELPSEGGVRPWSGLSLKAETFSREGPGRGYDWRDLCEPCQIAIKAFLLPILELRPTLSERRTARQALTTLLDWANAEAADYVMVRMLRIFNWNLKVSDDA